MKILNQFNRYVIDEILIQKIEHMVNHGYGSFKCGNLIASYVDTEVIDDETYVFIRVERA